MALTLSSPKAVSASIETSSWRRASLPVAI
jgi:hypothetical protein